MSFDIAKDRLKHRVLALPSLRGGLLVHALKKIKKRTGVKWALRGCFRCVRGAVNMLAPIVVDRFRTTVPVVAIALKEYSLANYRCSVAI